MEDNIDKLIETHSTPDAERKLRLNVGEFKLSTDRMIAVNDSIYSTWGTNRPYGGQIEYTDEQIQNIINGADPDSKRDLSRNYFYRNTLYMRLLLHYATLPLYRWFLAPIAHDGRSMKDRILMNKYTDALNFLDKVNIRKLGVKFSTAILRDGCYYGLIVGEARDSLNIIDLPPRYCRNKYTDPQGNDILEFNLQYFDSILDQNEKALALASYPTDVQVAYANYKDSMINVSNWYAIDINMGICFPSFGNQPLFLATLSALLNYEEYTELERERDEEEIKKIVIQKIPHLNDGELLFQPEEAEEIHRGTVNMMKKNKNYSVLTTYADVEVAGSESVNETVSKNNLEKILAGVYERAGVSPQVFAASGNLSLTHSLTNDLALMMIFVEMYNSFFTSLLNRKFGTNDISFQFTILPISHYNENEYHERTMKMVLSGYSLLLPWVALGMSQRTLVSVKDLENDVLGLTDKLIPPMNSNSMDTGTAEGGRPTKPATAKSPRTLGNEKSKDTGGQKQ